MNTNKLETIMAILNTGNYLPNGIDMNTRLRLLKATSADYQYHGNKYAESNQSYNNVAVALQFEHSMVEKPFWIVLFRGAQYKRTDEQFVAAFWDLPNVEDAIYQEYGIKADEQEDGVETILDIVQKFDYLWFTEDEASDYQPLTNDDPNILDDLARELLEVDNLEFNLSIKFAQIDESHIRILESVLEEAKEALKENKSRINADSKLIA